LLAAQYVHLDRLVVFEKERHSLDVCSGSCAEVDLYALGRCGALSTRLLLPLLLVSCGSAASVKSTSTVMTLSTATTTCRAVRGSTPA